MSASAPVPAPAPPNSQIAKLFSSPIDDRIAHLNRVLSTASGIDSTLCFLGYGLIFVSTSLDNVRTSQLFRKLVANVNEKTSAKTPDGLPAATGAAARLADFAASAKVLGGMCSDFRTAMRLWGLLKIWAGAKATYFSPPKDGILKVVAWSQLSSMAAYLVLENNYYLWSKGVIKGMTAETMGKRLRAAIWVFAAYIVLDFVRLGRVVQLRAEEKSDRGEKIDAETAKAALKDQDRAWYRTLTVDLAYFPLCFGWGGAVALPEWAFGLGGALAGFANFREALRVTAA